MNALIKLPRLQFFQLQYLKRGVEKVSGGLFYKINTRSWSERAQDVCQDPRSLQQAYRLLNDQHTAVSLECAQDPTEVFANNELNLEDVDVFGFDYDYTLASYKSTLAEFIYHQGCEALIEKFKYPAVLRSIGYDPSFAIRGLHYDVKRGLLMKIDSFMNIQIDSVHRGLSQVPEDEVKDLFGGTHISIEDISFYGTGPRMYQLMDLFALPEITLLANTLDFFVKNRIPYDPECVFNDVRHAVQMLHNSGLMHQEIIENTEKYLLSGDYLHEFLSKLNEAGKKLFLITNSGINFVDKGMKYMIGSDWLQLFDVVITNARKPKFFTDSRPFRMYYPDNITLSWAPVQSFKKGSVYFQGNLGHLQEFTNWYGSKVLYFGDHVYSDLADPTLKHGWRTGAIIPELEGEIKIQNSSEYQNTIRWYSTLHNLILLYQESANPECQKIVSEWKAERAMLRKNKKHVFNPRFGSLFRTYHNPTYFTRRLIKFADIYTSSLENLMKYSLKHTFYPRRTALPHELESFTGHRSTMEHTCIIEKK